GPATGAGQLDGVVALDDGTLLFSSWEKKAIFRGPKAGPFKAVAENLEAPADIGWGSKRKQLLIPRFTKSELYFLPLWWKVETQAAAPGDARRGPLLGLRFRAISRATPARHRAGDTRGLARALHSG